MEQLIYYSIQTSQTSYNIVDILPTGWRKRWRSEKKKKIHLESLVRSLVSQLSGTGTKHLRKTMYGKNYFGSGFQRFQSVFAQFWVSGPVVRPHIMVEGSCLLYGV